MRATEPPIIESHGLAAPTSADARAYLANVLGEERADGVWLAACEAAGFSPSRELQPVELMTVAKEIAAQGPLPAAVAHSLWVRVRSYVSLARLKGGQDDGEAHA